MYPNSKLVTLNGKNQDSGASFKLSNWILQWRYRHNPRDTHKHKVAAYIVIGFALRPDTHLSTFLRLKAL